MNINNKTPVATFKIPEDVAHALSDALLSVTIRTDVAKRIFTTGDHDDYYAFEKETLVPLYNTIESLQRKITTEFVPEEYRSSEYTWNYNGWNVDQNTCSIYETE